MGLIILIVMIGVPIGEIAVFIEAGDRFGFWPTIGAIIATAFVGTACMRFQGLSVLRRVQESMARNEMPLREVFDGLCLLLAGALLLTPGFITDAVGFCLLFPPFRYVVGAVIAARFAQRAQHVRYTHTQTQARSNQGFSDGGPVIDGVFEEAAPGGEDEKDRITDDTTKNP
ncbi:MAG: FxsA family protein [Rhodospirillales bacterium]|jgi:UPF0716 protein FxsA|nr:FxsA family protein [Rhodospirillales bacterium]MBT4039285.1 FxsA family protein [Rhodospirillales bacterium]MBT4628237.1 FxsA family protein [Rhodospirillales bacterium]MBT5351986.1 FxsA family protein [Rhodospirillales bacterium]MBT5519444.1 FxsA family protein [Rhodospirillales bacterium]